MHKFGSSLSVLKISVLLQVSQMGYRYRVVPYRFWRFCATSERPRRSKTELVLQWCITIILSVTHILIYTIYKPHTRVPPISGVGSHRPRYGQIIYLPFSNRARLGNPFFGGFNGNIQTWLGRKHPDMEDFAANHGSTNLKSEGIMYRCWI
jgi:hypothetical protein